MRVKMILPALTEAKSPFWSAHLRFALPSLGTGNPRSLSG